MSYQVIARKWRPQTFDDIVGQEHLTTTLKNAIETKRVGHAYLFTGIRGVGKTTAARVFAKALSCVHGPAPTPCNACDPCLEITRGTSMDVKEIDGASNRGIDSIRELRDGVAFAPARDRYKIYIIDEVHMLTGEAFNALLKTLEEPPSHCIFIFATTELHKVPATIASRCQVFEFKRVAIPTLVARMQMIAESESINIDEDSLRLVAREADGSVRDALSLLDQVISFCGPMIRSSDVEEILHTGNRASLDRCLKALLDENPQEAIALFDEALQGGMQPRLFLKDLSTRLGENIRVWVLGPDSGMETGLTKQEILHTKSLLDGHGLEALSVLLSLLVQASDQAADSRSPDLVALSALIRASRLSSLTMLDQLIAELENTDLKKHSVASRKSEKPVPRTPAVSDAVSSQPSPILRPVPQEPTPVRPLSPTSSSPSESKSPPGPNTSRPKEDILLSHPTVDRLLGLFGGEILHKKDLGEL